MHKKLHFYLIVCLVFLTAGQIHAKNDFYVRWVDDGDTIVLVDGRRVRYIGINAPEVAHRDQKAEPYGSAAKNFNKKLVLAKRVFLEFDREKNDHYGRLLAYIFLEDGTFVNRMILARGLAYFLYRRPNLKYADALLKTQRKAMGAKQGIWSDWEEKDGFYLGNKKSKRFHLPECPLGKKIAKRNRIYFRRQWDAFWDGYAPAKKCFAN